MDKEKLVRNLVNTFNDRDELHEAYKSKMKQIFIDFYCTLEYFYETDASPSQEILKFIDNYVEERFRPEK